MYSGVKWFVLAGIAAVGTVVALIYNGRHYRTITSGCVPTHPCDPQLVPYVGHPVLVLAIGLPVILGLVLLGIRASRR